MTRAFRNARRTALVVLALALTAGPAHAIALEPWRGHFGLGYAKLFAGEAPGGSMSVEGGLDYPMTPRWRLGGVLGYHLLGSRVVERGSLAANLDYSAFTAALQVHWLPQDFGPVERISAGPALFNGHVELSTSGGGAGFADLALGDTAPGMALDATLMSTREAPVRVGFEVGTRIGFFADETWTLGTARLVFHY